MRNQKHQIRLEWRPRAAAQHPTYSRLRTFASETEALDAAKTLCAAEGVLGDEFRLTEVDKHGAPVKTTKYFRLADLAKRSIDRNLDRTDWETAIIKANVRMTVMTAVRRQVITAWNHGLLERSQAAAISMIVEMAFDGFGPAGLIDPGAFGPSS